MRPALLGTLKDLQLEYLDLYLVSTLSSCPDQCVQHLVTHGVHCKCSCDGSA